jgi:hypothetical protein
MSLVHEASNKARGVAQAGTALVFGADAERHPGGPSFFCLHEKRSTCYIDLLRSHTKEIQRWFDPDKS